LRRGARLQTFYLIDGVATSMKGRFCFVELGERARKEGINLGGDPGGGHLKADLEKTRRRRRVNQEKKGSKTWDAPDLNKNPYRRRRGAKNNGYPKKL